MFGFGQRGVCTVSVVVICVLEVTVVANLHIQPWIMKNVDKLVVFKEGISCTSVDYYITVYKLELCCQNYPTMYTVYFHADRSSCHGGFHFSGHHGVFDDDSGPSANYGPNINCSYYITVPDNHIMSLKFLSLSIEPSPGCVFDYLNIWDVDAGSLLKQICGQIQPGIIVSSGQHIRLQLVTDASLQFTGFSVSYRGE